MRAEWAADIIIINDKQPCDCLPRDEGQHDTAEEKIAGKEMYVE